MRWLAHLTSRKKQQMPSPPSTSIQPNAIPDISYNVRDSPVANSAVAEEASLSVDSKNRDSELDLKVQLAPLAIGGQSTQSLGDTVPQAPLVVSAFKYFQFSLGVVS